ncbi:MAG: DUF3570 domain-containing protein [Deltaproteobacteria bacterium]|nr:DUF3570 domain-containing protein [Deltaproteobacteria bacterium]
MKTASIKAIGVAGFNSFTSLGERTELLGYISNNQALRFVQAGFETFIGSSGLKFRAYAGAGDSTPTLELARLGYAGTTRVFGASLSYPLLRRRLAPTLWTLWSIPKAKLVVEPRYRFYADDWGLRAHSADVRLHFRPHPDLRLRLRYRYYTQNQAFFWRDDGVWADDYPYRSDDPKMDDFRSNTVGLELTYGFDSLARVRGFRWLEGAWIQATYNHVFVRCEDLSSTCQDQDMGYAVVRTTRYGDNRIGSLAFSLAF